VPVVDFAETERYGRKTVALWYGPKTACALADDESSELGVVRAKMIGLEPVSMPRVLNAKTYQPS
jgi:hypothetical protein